MISSYLSYNLPITITIILLHSHCLLKKPDSPKNISSNISLCFPQLLKFSIKKKKSKKLLPDYICHRGRREKTPAEGMKAVAHLDIFFWKL